MTPDRIGLVLLASGLSRRFGADKLMADLGGAPLLDRTARLDLDGGAAARIAVVGHDQPARATLLADRGWTLVFNPSPERGQGRSIALGVGAVRGAGLDAAMIVLADMPLTPRAHLEALAIRLAEDDQAVMSVVDERLMPPAIFRSGCFSQLEALEGDEGARRVIGALGRVARVPLEPHLAVDIDTPLDLDDLAKRG